MDYLVCKILAHKVNVAGGAQGGFVDEGHSAESRLLAIARGDQRAFADFYGAMAPRVHGLALRVLRDRHLAEEVTQEVFLLAWRTSSAFDPARGTALAWMMTLTHRRAVDRVRSTAASRRRDAAYAEDERLWAPYDSTESQAHASLEGAAVRTALADLTAEQREAIELAYFGGHTHTEISTLMGSPVGTAKGRIRDGLAKLRDSLVVPAPEPA